jgi:flagellar hook-basal body complex protein FliE
MDTIIKGLADLLLVGGTVGSYAMITIIMLIVGYFKYFKPFLTDFAEIKGTLDVFMNSHGELSVIGEDIERKLDDVIRIAQSEHGRLGEDIKTEHREQQAELLNLLKTLNKELDQLQGKSEKLKMKTEDNHKDVMIEIAKLQTRLEYMNQSGARGIQK